MDCTITIHEDGKVDAHDVDLSTARAQVAAIRGNPPQYLALRLPGRKYWSKLGAPFAYAPAEIQFFEVLGQLTWKPDTKTGTLRLRKLLDVPVREPK